MHSIYARTVNDGLSEALRGFMLHTSPENDEQSRNGPVAVFPMPVCTSYTTPWRRVLFSPKRNANPFFHLMEGLWMLAGRNDLAWPLRFNKRFAGYSDDGETIHGAYGYRWRNHFGVDQMHAVITELVDSPNSRRAVLTMWDPTVDLSRRGADLPCNTHIYFDRRGGVLNMTVCCRSNDVLWGCYGANAVHMSMLQEFIAFCVGVPIGIYRQMSNNLHIYTDVLPRERWQELILDVESADGYSTENNFFWPMNGLPFQEKNNSVSDIPMYPLVQKSGSVFLREVSRFIVEPDKLYSYTEPFVYNVAQPMFNAWVMRRKSPDVAMTWAKSIEAIDWRVACVEWLERLYTKLGAKK